MEDKIVRLTDRMMAGDINQDIVTLLEQLLDRAKRGEIDGIAYATSAPNDVCATGWDGSGGTMFRLHSAVSTLHHRFNDMVAYGDQDE
jgi:hypothetical protein